jgi:HD-like signal output (HDOD) protein
VREQYPHVVRLCLSGTVDEDALVRAMPMTHQFLGKPCSADALCEVVERVCSLRAILQNDAIRQLIGKLNSLPTTPQTFEALSSAMSQPNAHTDDIAKIVSKDTSLCIKILQIVNSAFFRRGAPIASIHAAITFVGMEMIKSLALSACVFNALDASPIASKLVQDLQARSIRKAHFARMLLHESRQADEAFTAALLLDIGEAVLALADPQKFERMVATARNSHRPWQEVEPEFYGVAHPEVGAYLLGLWGLPLDLIEAVAFHHAPSQVQHGQTRVLAAVHVADAVIDATSDHSARLLDNLDADFVERTEIVRCLKAWNIDTDTDVQSAQRLVVE